MTERISRIVSSRSSTTRGEALPVIDVGGAATTRLDRHPGREELLDHDVVQVASDPLAVLDHPEVLLGQAQAFLGLDPFTHVTHDLDVTRGTPVVARGSPASGSRRGDRCRHGGGAPW